MMSDSQKPNLPDSNGMNSNQVYGPNQSADRIRIQFESRQRQTELAPEMSCFRPGGELHSLRFIAHPHGLHVGRWLQILSHTQAHVVIDTANPVPAFANDFVVAHPLVSRSWKLPMILRYVLGGLAMRFLARRDKNGVVHAHCASGNGFVAWLSGQRYLIGCYGSEILLAKQRGPLYCWLMTRILHGAERISAFSRETGNVVIEQFGVPAERVYCFHLGYDDSTFSPLNSDQRRQLRVQRLLPVNEPIWVVNRRTHPHYRTLEVVQGFLDYCLQDSRGRLVVLCGDCDPKYTNVVCNRIQQHECGHRITIVNEMLSGNELASWLQLGDFSISVPRTDGFSISTLESLGCATVPILADLAAYDRLRPCRAIRWISHFEPSDFTRVFADTHSKWSRDHERQRNECLQFVKNGFSTEGAIRDIAEFYLGHPLQADTSVQRAA